MKSTKLLFVFIAVFSFSQIAKAQLGPQVDGSRSTDSLDIRVAGDVEDISAGPDSATIGAIMPFRVVPDPTFQGNPAFNASEFTWTTESGDPLTDESGANIVNPTADTVVLATYPNVVDGTDSIFVYETSNPKSGSGCDGPTLKLEMLAVDQATATFAAADTFTVGCAAAQVDIDYDFSGYAPFYVQYTISYTDLSDVPDGTPGTYTAVVNSAEDLEIYIDQLEAVSPTASAAEGKYTVQVSGVWDRFSYKRATNWASLGTVPADDEYMILLYPTPTNTGIRQLNNFR